MSNPQNRSGSNLTKRQRRLLRQQGSQTSLQTDGSVTNEELTLTPEEEKELAFTNEPKVETPSDEQDLLLEATQALIKSINGDSPKRVSLPVKRTSSSQTHSSEEKNSGLKLQNSPWSPSIGGKAYYANLIRTFGENPGAETLKTLQEFWDLLGNYIDNPAQATQNALKKVHVPHFTPQMVEEIDGRVFFKTPCVVDPLPNAPSCVVINRSTDGDILTYDFLTMMPFTKKSILQKMIGYLKPDPLFADAILSEDSEVRFSKTDVDYFAYLQAVLKIVFGTMGNIAPIIDKCAFLLENPEAFVSTQGLPKGTLISFKEHLRDSLTHYTVQPGEAVTQVEMTTFFSFSYQIANSKRSWEKIEVSPEDKLGVYPCHAMSLRVPRHIYDTFRPTGAADIFTD